MSNTENRLRVELCGLELDNPIIPASGTFGYGYEFAELYDINVLGSFSFKGTTYEPRFGNPTPRIAECPMGMLNSIGLQNPGVHSVIEHELPKLKQVFNKKAIANVGGFSVEEYAKTAEEKGFKVIIAGAGMAAHLPGMCASIFPMPVIGIPMHTTSLGGRDSLYSIVQMPTGIPVATVAINGGANAGILAAKILATSDAQLLEKLKDYSASLKDSVVAKDKKLQEKGYKDYKKD